MGMKIILITDRLSGQRWAYTSIAAALRHIENPVDVTPRRWSQIVRERGYPFEHSGCRIELLNAMTGRDVAEDNPPLSPFGKTTALFLTCPGNGA